MCVNIYHMQKINAKHFNGYITTLPSTNNRKF